MIRNQRLHDAILLFYKEVCEIRDLYFEYRFEEFKNDSRLESFNTVIELMESDENITGLIGKMVGVEISKRSMPDIEYCLFSFIQQLGDKGFKFEEDYQRFEDLFYSNVFEGSEYTKLYNFEFSGDRIELGKGLSIYKTFIYRRAPEKYQYHGFIIERRTTTPINRSPDTEYKKVNEFPTEIFDRIIKSLRLLKQSAVYRDKEYITENITWLPMQLSIGFTESYEIPNGEICVIKEDEIPELKRIFKYVSSNTENKAFTIVLNRLNYGIERTRPEDKLLDYMIGLESLYLPDGNAELTFRLSIRIARLLGESSEQRLEIFTFIKDIYNKRSKIAHGKQHSITGKEINRTEDLFRKSLNIYINDSKKFSEEYLNVILVE